MARSMTSVAVTIEILVDPSARISDAQTQIMDDLEKSGHEVIAVEVIRICDKTVPDKK